MWTTWTVTSGAVAGGLALLRARNLHLWLPSYWRRPRRRLRSDERLHVFLAVCDHFEPELGGVSRRRARERVERWCRQYPRLFARFHDSRGQVPQHTFFFPADQYRPEYLERLAELCRAGYGDVDVHLHHDADTPDALFEKLDRFRDTLFFRHGLLRRDPLTGRVVYGFIHGNWALCNSRPDGRWCGVDDELSVLLQTGCYADFTLPSAPENTQTRTINSIYYARPKPGPKAHDTGTPARVGSPPPSDSLLLIQGPLLLDWQDRKYGLLPRIENADLHARRPPSLRRFLLWLSANVHVAGRPDWLFVKLHTHGCHDANADVLLGPEMENFHSQLAQWAHQNPNVRYYYVTAWQMAQLVHQAEQGQTEPQFEPLVEKTDVDEPAQTVTVRAPELPEGATRS